MHIQFLGASQEVTGSKYLIQGKANGLDHCFLVDYGMFQGGREADAKNLAPLPIDPSELDFVILTHAHIDHSGLLPRLCAQGFKGDIYCTPTTAALLKIMLLDSAHLQEADFERAQRKQIQGRWKGDLPIPLYNTLEAIDCLAQLKKIPFHQRFSPAPGIFIEFFDAGHILGSAITAVDIEEQQGQFHRTVFSGDLGMFDRPLVNNPDFIEQADTLIIESTYGDRLHRQLSDTEDEIVEVIVKTLQHNGNVIIPAFAVGRTQEIIFMLVDLVRRKRLPHLNIWVDSPMATSVSHLTEEHLSELDDLAIEVYEWYQKNSDKVDLRFVADVEESKALNRIKGGAIVISASGMCEAGRIVHHLKWNLPHQHNAIIITGFQAAGTLGRRLVDQAKSVHIFGKEVPVKASIHTIGGLSAHADQAGLIRWLKGFKSPPKHVYITHGEINAANLLLKEIQSELKWHHLSVPSMNAIFPL
jgi:metallo-beta-lactamase family protein